MGHEVRVRQYYPYPPALVWRALTRPAPLADWLGSADAELTAKRSVALSLRADSPLRGVFYGEIACEVTHAEPERLLECRWHHGEATTRARWVFKAEAFGVWLELHHDGHDDEATAATVRQAWDRLLRVPLLKVLVRFDEQGVYGPAPTTPGYD